MLLGVGERKDMENNALHEYKNVPVLDLIRYKSNSRTHSDDQIKKLVRSIQEFGFTNPLIIDEFNVIIAGHGRLDAALSLGITEIACIVLTGLTTEQKAALVIADNKIALDAGWDLDILESQLDFLKDADYDFTLTGFSLEEITDIFPEENKGLCDEDEIPPSNDEPVTVIGDIWLLGEHRLMCCDNTDIHSTDRLMREEKANMVFTDPPYDLENEEYCETIFMYSENAHVFVMHDDRGIVRYLKRSPLEFNRFFVADFIFCSPRGNDPYLRHILVSHEKQTGAIPHINQKDGLSSILKMEYRGNLKEDRIHDHQKPIDFLCKFITHYSREGSVVLDVFGGSGSTLIACEKLKRRCFMCELNPGYCDVIIQRWEKYTGKRAIHEGTGEFYKLNPE